MVSEDDERWRCDGCRRLFRPDHLDLVADWVETSRTSGRYRSGSASGSSTRFSRGGVSTGRSTRSSTGWTSGTTTRSRVERYLCPDCARKRAKRIARQKLFNLIGLCFLAGIGGVIFFSISTNGGGSSGATINGTANSAGPKRDLSDGNVMVVAGQSAENTTNQASGGEMIDGTAQPNAPPDQPNLATADDDIQRAVRQSLQTGQAARWASSDGRSGYATTSAAQLYGVKQCKSYRYTVVDPHSRAPWTSPDAIACRDGDAGVWNLATAPPG